jgi:hypothetical protein
MERLIDNPIPKPSGLLVKKRVKSLGILCAGIPHPESFTATIIVSVSKRFV